MSILHLIHDSYNYVCSCLQLCTVATLQKLKYDIHTKLPLESYQIQIQYDSSGNLV